MSARGHCQAVHRSLARRPRRPRAANCWRRRASKSDSLHFAATVDNIRRDASGRVRFHYTIIDFATRWAAGEPVAATDVTEAAWAKLDDLEEYNLWSEAHRVIAIARRLVG